MLNLIDSLPEEARSRLKKIAMPKWVNPMLATLTDKRFSRPGWIYEPKYDGERVLAFKQGHEVALLSRNKKQLSGGYPDLVKALKLQKHDFIADGEVVAFKDKVPSFEKLQERIGLHDIRATEKGIPVFYYLFDLMYLDGYDLRDMPLRYRKGLLEKIIIYQDPLRYTPHMENEGESYFSQMCHKGWEGVIAKDFSAAYSAARSRNWLKFKCVSDQELVIGGYTDPRGSRTGFGALLVGYYNKDQLRYAGKVGTGFDEALLKELYRELKSLEQDTSPFADKLSDRGTHWVRPRMVAEIGFTEWTKYGKLRHPRFKGLRQDKPAREVVREAT
jgi:bifunctional non-homologous end joining protein LigD